MGTLSHTYSKIVIADISESSCLKLLRFGPVIIVFSDTNLPESGIEFLKSQITVLILHNLDALGFSRVLNSSRCSEKRFNQYK